MSPSMVVALIALVIALGGTSYAAVTLPRNSVGTRQIRTAAVRSAEVKDRSLRLADISRGARAQLRGQRGPAGAPGPPGSSGPGGSGTVTVKTAAGSITAAPAEQEVLATATATCDPGQRAVGGGASSPDPQTPTMHSSFPAASGTGWTATLGNDTDAAKTFTVYVVCVT
jgi:hypothetical protein